MYYPIVSQKDIFVDNQKKVIANGKIEFFDPVSLNRIDTFTYNEEADDNFVIAENPIYLNGYGRPQQTYFTKQLTFCRLYKYIGNFSDPRLDDDTNNWGFVREWFGNTVDENLDNSSQVFTVANLKNIDPTANGYVYVVGYRTKDDCEGRVYVWDPTSNDAEDGGYVIASNNSSTGRWILKFDGEYIPSSYYGVYPGNEANMNALMSYVSEVGTERRKTAPGVYFIPGNYDITKTSIVTNKKLLIDANTQFIAPDITCADVKVIGTPSQPITDIYFQTGSNANADTVAYSSWYRSVSGFWKSGAKTLVMSRKQNFTNKTISFNISITNTTVRNPENTYFTGLTYTNSAWLRFSNCNFEGENMFDPVTEHLNFSNMEFTDRYFRSYNDNRLIFTDTMGDYTANVCFITVFSGGLPYCNIHRFREPANYVRAMNIMGKTSIDLEGKTVDGEKFKTFSIIKNGILNNAELGDNAFETITLQNCEITGATVNVMNLFLEGTKGSIKTFPYLKQLVLSKNSVISDFGDDGQHPFNLKRCAVKCYDSTWNWNTSLADDNVTKHTEMLFVNSVITDTTLDIKDIDVQNCSIVNANINVYPYYEDGHFRYKLRIRDSYVNNENPITFEIKDPYVIVNETNGYCQDIIFQQLSLINNVFIGNNDGVKCTYWAIPYRGSLHIAEYDKNDSTVRHNINCKGNEGNIPDGHDNYYYMGTHYRPGDPSAWYDWETGWAGGSTSVFTPYKVAFVKRRLFMAQSREDRMATPFYNKGTFHQVDVPNCITRKTSNDDIINMNNPHYLSYAEFCKNNHETTPPVDRDDTTKFDDYFAWLFAVRSENYNEGYNYTVF